MYSAACWEVAASPWDKMTLVFTCSCLALEQREELKFVVCSLLEALFELCTFQASSGLLLSSQGVCVCLRKLVLVGRTVGKHAELFHSLMRTDLVLMLPFTSGECAWNEVLFGLG